MSVLILCRCIFMGTGEADDASPIPFSLYRKFRNSERIERTGVNRIYVRYAPVQGIKNRR